MLSSLQTTVVTPLKCAAPRRAGSPSSTSVRPLDADRGGEAVGVDLLGRRGEQQVDALGLGQLGVALLVARVGVQVLVRAELGRVHEQRDHDHVVLGRARRASATGGRRGRSPSWARGRSVRPAARRAPARRAARRRCGRSSLPRSPWPGRGCGPPSRRTGPAARARSPRRRRAGGPRSRRRRGRRARSARARGRARPSSRPCCAPAGPAACAPGRARRPAPPAMLLGRRLQRDQEVGRDRGGGVVGGAAVVASSNGSMPRLSASSRATSSAAGVEPAIAQPTPSRWRGVSLPANVWSGWRPNCSAPAAARAASGVAPLVWPTIRAEPASGLGRGADLGVGNAQQRHVGAGRRLAAAERARDLVAGLAERGGQHPAEPAGADHADALGRERLICGDRFHSSFRPGGGCGWSVMWELVHSRAGSGLLPTGYSPGRPSPQP